MFGLHKRPRCLLGKHLPGRLVDVTALVLRRDAFQPDNLRVSPDQAEGRPMAKRKHAVHFSVLGQASELTQPDYLLTYSLLKVNVVAGRLY